MGFVFGLFLGAMGDMQPLQMVNGREVPQAPLREQVRGIGKRQTAVGRHPRRASLSLPPFPPSFPVPINRIPRCMPPWLQTSISLLSGATGVQADSRALTQLGEKFCRLLRYGSVRYGLGWRDLFRVLR